ncbi:hypothetical protein ACFOKF_20580 [Sphingobium rhizovicinum]|uniref:Autotransporter domain-containing protein n=1 Tax=Sphingobium rhizovicinum TaxID=432308 RepID=A0ABV7NL40_9SPHN
MRAPATGRPFRFFGLAMIAWIAIRFGGIDAPILVHGTMPRPDRIPIPTVAPMPFAAAAMLTPMRRQRSIAPFHRSSSGYPSHAPRRTSMPPLAAINLRDFMSEVTDFAGDHISSTPAWSHSAFPAATPPPSLPRQPPDRWRVGAWLLWRAGSGAPAGSIAASRLGGSQAGLRVDYELTPDKNSRVTAYARVSRALDHPSAPEAATGLAVQPVHQIPVSLAMERRIALGAGGRNANSLMAFGGFNTTRIARGVEAEGYAQAGIVGFRNRDAFVDGKLSVLTPLPGLPIRAGASVSGGAQPAAGRLDIGSELQMRLPRIPARLSIEWRHRIAGHARPGSGLAITLAADF